MHACMRLCVCARTRAGAHARVVVMLAVAVSVDVDVDGVCVLCVWRSWIMTVVVGLGGGGERRLHTHRESRHVECG